MNEYFAMLLDGDLGKWEVRAYTVAVAAAVFVAKFLFGRLVDYWDAAQKLRHADHIRLGQIDEEVVKGLRGGVSFPDLDKR